MPLNLGSSVELGLVALGFLLPACSQSLEEQSAEQEVELRAPSRNDFPPVSDALQLRCATLDCHGQVGRNLRIYGYGGLRLAADQSPLDFPTTEAEYVASYDSLVGLEPEVLSKVVTLEADPNVLAMIRKARGIEHHKGGQQMKTGDALDRCIVLWLQNKSDADACSAVVQAPHPTTE
jgi:hypothetical protein